MTADYFKDLNLTEALDVAACLTRDELLHLNMLSDWGFIKTRSRLQLEADLIEEQYYTSSIRKDLIELIQAPTLGSARKVALQQSMRYWKEMSLEELQRAI